MGYSDIGDNELIYLIRCNNLEAREYLFTRYQKRIYGMIDSFKNRTNFTSLDYRDYYQSCAIVLLKCIDSFDEDHNFYKYLASAINRELLKLLDKEKVQKEIASLEEKFADCDCFQNEYVCDCTYLYEENEINSFIDKNFIDLDKLIIRYRLLGYSFKEIASILNISDKLVYKKMAKIREVLKLRD